MILATYDGAYLHLWKYELFNQKESDFEHKTHTIRAILFPLIIWLLILNTDIISFWIGIGLVILDLIVLAVDAYSEKESRSFMGGLPQWEYILHLFANGFHFAFVILIIITKIKIESSTLIYSSEFLKYSSFEIVQLIAVNILPGAIVLGIVHLLLMSKFGRKLWNTNRLKIKCC
jgi:hypothetical protein